MDWPTLGGERTLQRLCGIMASRIWIFLAFVVAGCSTLDAGGPARELSYGCDDLVVIGRVATVSEASVQDSGVELANWRSEWGLQIRVKRVIQGSERRRLIPASAISHAEMRDDVDFLIVLRPNEDESYDLQTAALWQRNPRPILVEPCF